MKVKETDAAVMSVDARLAMSIEVIMMQATATIEWQLQILWSAESPRTRMCLHCGPPTEVQRAKFVMTRPSLQA